MHVPRVGRCDAEGRLIRISRYGHRCRPAHYKDSVSRSRRLAAKSGRSGIGRGVMHVLLRHQRGGAGAVIAKGGRRAKNTIVTRVATCALVQLAAVSGRDRPCG